MTEDALANAAAALRQAALQADFEVLPALVRRYAVLVERAASEMGPGSPAFVQLREQSCGLLTWARETAISHRAHAAARLQELLTAREYEPAGQSGHITETVG